MSVDDSVRNAIMAQISGRDGLANGVPPRDKPMKGGWIRKTRKNSMEQSAMARLPGGGNMNDTVII
jgi:hypothetical protein